MTSPFKHTTTAGVVVALAALAAVPSGAPAQPTPTPTPPAAQPAAEQPAAPKTPAAIETEPWEAPDKSFSFALPKGWTPQAPADNAAAASATGASPVFSRTEGDAR